MNNRANEILEQIFILTPKVIDSLRYLFKKLAIILFGILFIMVVLEALGSVIDYVFPFVLIYIVIEVNKWAIRCGFESFLPNQSGK